MDATMYQGRAMWREGPKVWRRGLADRVFQEKTETA